MNTFNLANPAAFNPTSTNTAKIYNSQNYFFNMLYGPFLRNMHCLSSVDGNSSTTLYSREYNMGFAQASNATSTFVQYSCQTNSMMQAEIVQTALATFMAALSMLYIA